MSKDKKSKPRKSCPDCAKGKLYLIGARWCCDRCPYGFTWHLSDRRSDTGKAA